MHRLVNLARTQLSKAAASALVEQVVVHDARRARRPHLIDSLVALSLTVEEKEECVLSSNRKDNAAFAGSEQDNQVS